MMAPRLVPKMDHSIEPKLFHNIARGRNSVAETVRLDWEGCWRALETLAHEGRSQSFQLIARYRGKPLPETGSASRSLTRGRCQRKLGRALASRGCDRRS